MRTKLSTEDRLLSNVQRDENGCWIWQRAKNSNGYGVIYMGVRENGSGGKIAQVHRVSYELFVGPIPNNMQIDHLCRVRACCNPEHLEAVTCRDNLLRSDLTKASQNQAKTACPRCGKPYRVYPSGRRRCLPCESRNDSRPNHH